MQEFLTQYDPRFFLPPLAIGVLLLVWGRSLYWLALGVVGFLLGTWVATDVLNLAGREIELGLGAILGVVGAVFAIFAQQVAIKIAGLIVGGGGVIWLAVPYEQMLGVWIWPLILLGAFLGLGLANSLFSGGLITISSLVGARMITEALFADSPYQIGICAALCFFGILVQSRGKKKKRE